MQAKTNGPPVRKGLIADRKLILLGVLVILIGGVLWAQYSGTQGTSHAGTQAQQTEKKKTPHGFEPLNFEDPNLPMAELLKEKAEDDGGKRNLFDFGPPPAPPPATTLTRKELEDKQAQMQPPAVCGNRTCEGGENYLNCPTDCQPPPQPPPPPVNLKYIGYMSEEGGPIAFLTDGKEVFMGKVNEIIANKYRILNITDQGVELGTLKRDQSTTIPFQGNDRS